MKAGRLRGLAVSTAQRSPFLPDLPTIAEAGVPGYDHTPWNGLLAPAKTPRAIIARLNEETARILHSPETKTVFVNEGAEPVGNRPEEFAAYIRAEAEKYARVIKASGAKAD